jgi:DNA topoisomerase I
MKNLIIVESPAKIKTISKFLGKDFKIVSTVGHIKDLPQKELGVTFNKEIDITYVTLEGKQKTIAEICKEAQSSNNIYLAPDPDREGEIIAWHVNQEISKVIKKTAHVYRISFNEITKPAIEEALAHPSIIDENKVAAQQARRILDRLVGYEVSPILWKKITKGLSAGRVQSVALKLICDREEAIKSFKPEEYWSIDGLFLAQKHKITAPLVQINKKKIDIKNEQDAKSIVSKIEKQEYQVDSIKDTKRLRNPLPPFMTSTLQQSAYNSLGFNVQRTMSIAQKLYEGIPLDDKSVPVALITYMRTDSLRIADTALKSTRDFIAKTYTKEYLPAQAQVYSKSKAQDAHEAIRPIDVTLTPDKVARYIPGEAAKLYELIWQRFVASQIKPAQYAQRAVTIIGGPFTFKVTGSTLIFDGFLKVYNTEEDDKESDTKVKIPAELEAGMPLKLDSLAPKQHFTQPPPRFTEGSLVKDLEKEGIGRPSTYATILKTIQARAYTTLDPKKRFVPTELGVAVTKMLTDNLPKIMNVQFTALMEEDLDKVAQGELERDILLKTFYRDFEKDLEAFRGGQAKRVPEKTDIKCPDCKKNHLVIRFGKSGPFAGCETYPACKFTGNFERLEDGSIKLIEAEQPQMLDTKCPQCTKQLRKMMGRFGEFISCSGYPDCKYIQPVKASFACLTCKKGDVIQRMWKGKKFWGCSTYPTCTFSIAGDIEQTACKTCKLPYLLKRVTKEGEVSLVCSNKDCGVKPKKAK